MAILRVTFPFATRPRALNATPLDWKLRANDEGAIRMIYLYIYHRWPVSGKRGKPDQDRGRATNEFAQRAT